MPDSMPDNEESFNTEQPNQSGHNKLTLERISQSVLDNRFWVLLASFVITIAACAGLQNVKFSTDYRIYFSDDNPHLQAFEDLQATFTKSDNIMFVVTPKDGQVFSNQTLAIIEELTEAAWQLPYSRRVDSITNYQHTIAEEDDLLVDNLVIDPMDLDEAALAEIQAVALAEPSLAKRLIASDAKVTGVNVSIEVPGLEPNKEVPEVAAAAQAIQADFIERYDSIEVRLVGQIVNDNAFKEAALYDLSHIVPLAFLVATLCIAFYMFQASGSLLTLFSGTLATLAVVIFSILFAQGISAWIGMDITTASVNAPTMILTLAIADSIHVMASFFLQMQKGMDKRSAMLESLRINHQPVFLTSVTTIIGFLSLNFSDSPPFRELGNTVAIGVAGAWLFSITLLPALMMMLPVRVRQLSEEERGWPLRLANWIIRRSRPILVVSVLVMTTAISLLPRNELYDVWAEYFDTSMPARQDADYTRENLTGIGTISYVLDAKEEGGVASPEYLAKLAMAAEWLRAQPEIIHVDDFTNVMKRLSKSMHADDPSYYRLPDDKELAAQYILLYEMSLPFGLDLNNQLNLDKSQSRITATLELISTAELLDLQARANAWFAENMGEYEMSHGASSDVMFAHIGQSNIKSMLQGTAYALLLISLVLAISLRSSYYGFISLLPNVLPALVGFGLWGFFVGKIGLGLSVVFGMTLGIVVDYTVHFLSKFLRAKRENELTTEDAIRYAFSSVGVALSVTTFILFANFGILALSDYGMNADMGLMTAVTIVVALFVDFFFLPPLLIMLVSNQKKRAAKKEAKQQTSDEKDTQSTMAKSA